MKGFMLRQPIAVLLVVAVLCPCAAAATPEGSLELGMRAFRAGDFASAVTDLDVAAQPFAPSELQSYVETGRLERLSSFETALVYLALAQFRLGREDDARETILRLIAADTLGGTYSTLPLQSDAVDFETLVAALVPASTLPRNVQIAAIDPTLPLPAVRPVNEHGVAVTPEEERAVRQVTVREYVSRENERLQGIAGEEVRIAELPPAAPVATPMTVPEPMATPEPLATPEPMAVPESRTTPEPLASPEPRTPEPMTTPEPVATEIVAAATEPEPPATPTLTVPSIVAVERQADERVAEAQEDAARRIAATEAEAQKRIAAAEAAARAAQQAADSRDLQQRSQDPAPAMRSTDSAAVRIALGNLRQAEGLADNGEFEAADAIYRQLVASAPREVVVLAAIGLYRNGAYREAVDAFARIGAFARGEEDLHYYYAVSLYEAGQYDAARKELSCALPFIQLTDEVARYRLKIEQTMAQLSSTRF